VKKLAFKTIICFVSIFIGSCKKDTELPKTGFNQLFEIVINGQQLYNVTLPPEIVVLNGISSTTCDNKPGFLLSLYDPELNSRFSINTDLQYYSNEVDFKTKGAGSYSLTSSSALNLCHFNFNLKLNDKSQPNSNTTLLSGGVHTVTSITTISSSTGTKQVLVEGAFSGTYKNSVNVDIVVSGRYKKIIEILL
jgi:hypothetical protein